MSNIIKQSDYRFSTSIPANERYKMVSFTESLSPSNSSNKLDSASIKSVYCPSSTKGEKHMTFVAAIKSKSGIVMCSDSKGTRRRSDGTCFADDNPVKKVFKNKNTIMCTWGNNEVRSSNGVGPKKLEDILNELISKDMSGQEIVEELCRIIHSTPESTSLNSHGGEYCFFVGRKLPQPDGEYIIEKYTIGKGPGYQCLVLPDNISMLYINGSGFVLPEFLNFNTNKEYTIDEMVDFGKKLTQHVIQSGDEMLLKGLVTYNAVGGKIQVETFAKEDKTTEAAKPENPEG